MIVLIQVVRAHADCSRPARTWRLKTQTGSTRSILRRRLCANARPLIIDKEINMNWDRIEGNWKQLKGSVKEKWGKLTDDQLDVIAGKRDQLSGKIQETYGVSKDEVEKQISEWQKLLK